MCTHKNQYWHSAAERRLVHILTGGLGGGISVLPSGKPSEPAPLSEKEIAEKAKKEKELQEANDKKEMELVLSERTNLVEDDIRNYLVEKEEDQKKPLNTYEQSLKDHFLTIDSDNDPAKVQASLALIRQLCESLNAKNKATKDRSVIRKSMDLGLDQESSPTKEIFDIGKDGVKKLWDGFNSPQTNFADKAVMLGGVAIGIAGLAAVWKYFFSDGTKQGFKRFLAGVGVGLGAIVVVDGIYRLAKNAYATEKSQDVKSEDVANILRKDGIPAEFLSDIGKDNKGIIPVAAILDMKVEEFLKMHQVSKASRTLNALPKKNLPTDGLSPYERFAIIDDIAKTTGIVDAKGEQKELPDILKQKSMLTVIMSYKDNPLIPKPEPK